MEKTLVIEGMSCSHCSDRVEKALNAIKGVSAKVDLNNKLARLEVDENVDMDEVVNAVIDAGYSVAAVK
ncbi:MAG: heavy metal-associated domain-containing protein [Eubacteriales bacterium]